MVCSTLIFEPQLSYYSEHYRKLADGTRRIDSSLSRLSQLMASVRW